jgi:hypothetical protein
VEAARWLREAMAMRDDPLLFNTYTAIVPSSAGQLQESLRIATSSVAHTGLVRFSIIALALVHAMVGMDDVAKSYIDKALEIGVPPSLPPLTEIISLLHLRHRRYENSLQLILQALPSGSSEPALVDAVRGFHRALMGDMRKEDAVAALMRIKETRVIEEALNVKRTLLWLTMLGAVDEAYEIMDASLDAAAISGTVGSAWGVLWLKEMKPFRDDPRFIEVAKRIGFTDYWREYGPPDGYEFVNGRLFAL